MSNNHHHDHFITISDDAPDSVKRRVRMTALLSMVVAIILIAIKSVAWVLTGSVAMLGALLDSVLDFSISLMNFFAIRHAQTPADKEHRFGHGKAEALAALAQGVIIAGAAIFLVVESAQAGLATNTINYSTIGIATMVISIVLTLALVFVQRRVARSTKSIAISADEAHYASDVYMNVGVIAALVLSSAPFNFLYADAICGVIVAGILARGAWRIIFTATTQLMDAEMSEEERSAIRKIITSHPQVRGLHDLRTRRAGLDCFVQCHIELDGTMSLTQAHTISDAVEEAVCEAFPNAQVLIHQDPDGAETITPLEKT
ncbi:MAG: cation diffusion facilitator family transporter [Alphaproteobacteria bacterium]|nr:cation diffusion facilitator family transporter [Alphaproteobacteria bacterium]